MYYICANLKFLIMLFWIMNLLNNKACNFILDFVIISNKLYQNYIKNYIK